MGKNLLPGRIGVRRIKMGIEGFYRKEKERKEGSGKFFNDNFEGVLR